MNTTQKSIINTAAEYVNNMDSYAYEFIQLFDGLPSQFHTYCYPQDIDCWVVQFLRKELGLISSTLVAVSKAEGKVVWCGGAGDEG